MPLEIGDEGGRGLWKILLVTGHELGMSKLPIRHLLFSSISDFILDSNR